MLSLHHMSSTTAHWSTSSDWRDNGDMQVATASHVTKQLSIRHIYVSDGTLLLFIILQLYCIYNMVYNIIYCCIVYITYNVLYILQ